MLRELLEAQARSINNPGPENRGQFIRVGVIDSIYDFPDNWNSTAVEKRRFIQTTQRDTTGHGTNVCHIIGFLSTDAMFHLYQTVAENARYKVSRFLKAVNAARNSGLEILNISLGIHHADCGGKCRSCVAVNAVVKDGTTVVVASGTRKSDNQNRIHCPGLAEKAITTSVVIPECTASPVREERVGINRKWRPPNAIWLIEKDQGSHDEEEYFHSGNICSFMDCAIGFKCANYRSEVPWESNPDYTLSKPDILAPGFHTTPTSIGLRISTGTSYAAAMTSGAIAEILGELFERGKTAGPAAIKNAVVSCGDDLPGANIPKLNQLAAYRMLV